MPENRRRISVCHGTGCGSRSADVYRVLLHEIDSCGLRHRVELKLSGCRGFCQQGPLVTIEPDGILYTHIAPQDARDIIHQHIVAGVPVERLFYWDTARGNRIGSYRDIPFLALQTRRILRNCGILDPESIEDYIAAGGYQAARKALTEMTQDEVIGEVTRTGLLGSGGTQVGRRWATCRRARAEPKYVICNGDEGDPGVHTDRTLLESDPHSVIEGLVIGAYAVGARFGTILVRAEHSLAAQRLHSAIAQATRAGFLGTDILGSGHSLSLEVNRTYGSSVSSEATALAAWIEGWSGEPHPQQARAPEAGLWGKPTTIDNVATWAQVPLAIERALRRGAFGASAPGGQNDKWTMVFSLSGQVQYAGLAEVPLGTPLRRLVFDIGGGLPDGRELKAVQTGGPSGGCLPVELLDVPMDYGQLAKAGSSLGSGGVVAFDQTSCMVDVAKYFAALATEQSCGKCVPCREGMRRVYELLQSITEGQGRDGDIELLQEMAETISESSLCELGITAPNPVLTTIKYFSEEYRAHVYDKRCPALACKALTAYTIDPTRCDRCGICASGCPLGAIKQGGSGRFLIDSSICTKCGACQKACPLHPPAIVVTSGPAMAGQTLSSGGRR